VAQVLGKTCGFDHEVGTTTTLGTETINDDGRATMFEAGTGEIKMVGT
jgi:hypothetical protein